MSPAARRRKSPIRGRSPEGNRQPALGTPSVTRALGWLLDLPADAPERIIFMRAKTRGLLQEPSAVDWKVDGAAMLRLLQRALHRMPFRPDQLGLVLHGIGEFAARCHADLLRPFPSRLNQRTRLLPGTALEAAFQESGQLVHPTHVYEHAAAQALLQQPLSWKTLEYATAVISNPHRVGGGGRFGFRFVVKLFARTNVAGLDRWIRRNKVADPRLAAVVGALADDLIWQGSSETLARRLLQSANPLIRCLGAAAILHHPLRTAPPHTYGECCRIFTAGGIDAADAIWMASPRLKNAIHARYGGEHSLPQIRARRRYIEIKPDAAIGGTRHAQAECERLEREEAQCVANIAATENAIEQTLDDMARCWPSGGLSKEQMQWLDTAFVQTVEIRHRLAVKLPPGANRIALLETNIRQMKDAVGISHAVPQVFDEHFGIHADRLMPLLWWSAQSHCERYKDDKRGIGRQASLSLQHIVQAAEATLAEPFLAARQYTRWSSALGRLTCSHFWALLVVAATPPHYAAQISGLRDLAVSHIARLLRVSRNEYRDEGDLRARLIITAISHLSEAQAGEWAIDEKLPDHARAFAMWGAPALVREQPELASDLLRRAAQKPLSAHGNDRQVNMVVTLVDWAVARTSSSETEEYLALLEGCWTPCRAVWPHVLKDRLADLPAWLWTALREDGESRRELLGDTRFAHSHSVSQLLTLRLRDQAAATT
jgi:hypothetical protein